MRYLRQRLERIPTPYLMIYVALADLVMVLGIVPFELFCRMALVQHRNDVGLLLEILAANAALVVFLLSAMAIASLALGRGVSFALRSLKIKA